MSKRPLHVDHIQHMHPEWPCPAGAGLRLWVPDAPFRPGDEPRYSTFRQQPGDLPRPDPLAKPTECNLHALGLVRVLDDDGDARGPWDPHLSASALRDGLRWMVLTRHYDTRLTTMQRQGRLSFYVESRGEEAVGTAAGMVLRADDLLFPSYRQPTLFLVRGMSVVDMICHCIGNRQDVSKGRQMPVHYSWKKGHVVSISSPVGTQFSQAVGAAMAYAQRGDSSNVVATWIGDGTTAQGDFHYGLNFASVFRPPVILNVVNNQWAISTHCSLATGGATFASRAGAYGLPGIRVDGNDFLAVYAVTSWAAERARRGGGPTLIELLTYRAGAHSSSDDPSQYRPNDEARLWPGGDPIDRLAGHMIRKGVWTVSEQRQLQESARQQIVAAYKEAERIGSLADGPFEPPESLMKDVYRQPPWHLTEQQNRMRSA